MDIKVLGTGCANCKRTIEMIQQAAQAKGIAVNIEKVEDIRAIMGYGILSTPGVVVDGDQAQLAEQPLDVGLGARDQLLVAGLAARHVERPVGLLCKVAWCWRASPVDESKRGARPVRPSRVRRAGSRLAA